MIRGKISDDAEDFILFFADNIFCRKDGEQQNNYDKLVYNKTIFWNLLKSLGICQGSDEFVIFSEIAHNDFAFSEFFSLYENFGVHSFPSANNFPLNFASSNSEANAQ